MDGAKSGGEILMKYQMCPYCFSSVLSVPSVIYLFVLSQQQRDYVNSMAITLLNVLTKVVVLVYI